MHERAPAAVSCRRCAVPRDPRLAAAALGQSCQHQPVQRRGVVPSWSHLAAATNHVAAMLVKRYVDELRCASNALHATTMMTTATSKHTGSYWRGAVNVVMVAVQLLN